MLNQAYWYWNRKKKRKIETLSTSFSESVMPKESESMRLRKNKPSLRKNWNLTLPWLREFAKLAPETSADIFTTKWLKFLHILNLRCWDIQENHQSKRESTTACLNPWLAEMCASKPKKRMKNHNQF